MAKKIYWDEADWDDYFLHEPYIKKENNLEITEVKIKLVESQGDRLKAFCSITIDNNFVIRDLKIVEGVKGLFVAMPSRKIMERCPHCGGKNHVYAKYCNDCGKPLSRPASQNGRTKLHTDIAHPINSEYRELIQSKVLAAYEQEKGQPSPSSENDDLAS